MKDWRISSFPQAKTFLAGESLKVNTAFINGGDAPWEVAAPDEPSPLSYELRGQSGDRAHHVSHDAFVTLLRNEPPQRTEAPQFHAIEPGARLIRSEDVAELASEPFAPARYLLVSVWRGAEEVLQSRPAPLEIIAPTIESAASAFCEVRGSLTSVLVHRRPAEPAVMLVRESYRRRPALGTFRRIGELPDRGPVSDVQVFVDTADLIGGRWIAWVQDERVKASKAWGAAVEHRFADVGPAWEHLRLAGPGFQRADASGCALVTGQQDGRSLFAALRLDPAGAEVLWQATLSETPQSIAAAWEPAGRPWLVWSAANAVHASTGGPAAPASRVVRRLDGQLAAWNIPAVTRKGPVRVALLEIVSPSSSPQALRLHAVDLDGSEHVASDVTPPPDGVTAWALLGDRDGAPWILAATAGRLLSLRVGGGDWTEIGTVALESPRLQAFRAAGGEPWAEWEDPVRGLQRSRLGA